MKNFRSMMRDALAQAVQRRFDLRAERELLHHLAELHAHGVGGFFGDGFEAAVNVVAGAHGAREQIDGVGQVALRICASRARTFAQDVMNRAARRQQCESSMRSRKIGHEKIEDSVSNQRNGGGDSDHIRRAPGQVRLIDADLQALGDVPASRRNRRETRTCPRVRAGPDRCRRGCRSATYEHRAAAHRAHAPLPARQRPRHNRPTPNERRGEEQKCHKNETCALYLSCTSTTSLKIDFDR